MATYSQGCSVTFAGTAFGQVASVSLQRGGSKPIGRSATGYATDAGSVTVESFQTAGSYGAYGTLTISGGGVSLTEKAVCTGVQAVASANDVTRYTTTFDLIV